MIEFFADGGLFGWRFVRKRSLNIADYYFFSIANNVVEDDKQSVR